MSIGRFGTYRDEPVLAATLTSDAGVSVRILSFGAVVQSWMVPDKTGRPKQVTLGFDRFDPYPEHSRSFGIIAGRLANRVRDGRFSLDGIEYQLDRNRGPHHLHGGSDGLGRQLWTLEADGSRARLTHVSPDGAMGYPGEVRFTVDVALTEHTLSFAMAGVPDRPTPIALAQHSYYALGGPVADHLLTIAADRTTAVDDLNVPTGWLLPVDGTDLDFRLARPIGATPLDHNFCLTGASPAVTLEGADFRLTIETERPGLQIYNSFDMPPVPVPGHDGQMYAPWCGVALEAQDWPDAINHPEFPDVISTPDQPYAQSTAIMIKPR